MPARHRDLAPDQFAALQEMTDAVESVVGEASLRLVRSRVDLLLRSAGRVGHSSAGTPMEAAREAAIVEFVDQFVIDVTMVEDRHIDDLVSRGGVSFAHGIVNAAWILESAARAQLVLDRLLPSGAN